MYAATELTIVSIDHWQQPDYVIVVQYNYILTIIIFYKML